MRALLFEIDISFLSWFFDGCGDGGHSMTLWFLPWVDQDWWWITPSILLAVKDEADLHCRRRLVARFIKVPRRR